MALTKSSSKRCWLISVAVIILIIIAIAVPCAVINSSKGQGKRSTVILPLYVYPETNTTWNPLYDALNAHPELQFTVIVNPSSGPGSSQYPNAQYSSELEKLTAFPNVEALGYVRTGYATRDINDVISDLSTYAGWASKSSALAMHGIFFDESPHQYSPAAVEYMRTINQAAKNSTGLRRPNTIVHNPGTIPDARYNDTNTDITVIFEHSYTAYQTEQSSLATLPNKRSEYSYMVNSLPDMDKGKLRKFVNELSQRAEFLFVTNNDQDFYESFGDDWETFTEIVPS